jgi:hypothetical protein
MINLGLKFQFFSIVTSTAVTNVKLSFGGCGEFDWRGWQFPPVKQFITTADDRFY